MPRNNRELSQFASFVEIDDSVKKIGITTDIALSTGVGIGGDLLSYLDRIDNYGDPEESLIVFSPSVFLDSVTFDNDISIGSSAIFSVSGDAEFENVLVSGIFTAQGNAAVFNTEVIFGDIYRNDPAPVWGNDLFRCYNNALFSGITTFTSIVPVFFTHGAEFESGTPLRVNSRIIVTREDSHDGDPAGLSTSANRIFAVDVDGGISATRYMNVGIGLTVWDYLGVGGSASQESYFLSTTRFLGDLISLGNPFAESNIEVNSFFKGDIVKNPLNTHGIGLTLTPWDWGYFEYLNSSTQLDANILQVNAESSFIQAPDFIGGLNASGVATVANLFVGLSQILEGNLLVNGIATFTAPAVIDGVARTSVQARNVDINAALLDDFYYFPLLNQSGVQTSTGGELFVNQGLYYNPISSDFFIGGDLSVLNNTIDGDPGDSDLRFYLLNQPKYIEAFLTADELTIGGQASIGVATIRNGRTDVTILRVKDNNIQAGTGNTNITLVDNTNTIFYGSLEFNGDTIKTNRDTAYIFDQTVQYANVLGDAIHIDLGSNNVGITSIRSNRTELYGDLRLRSNQILASDEAVAIQLDSNRTVTIQGDLIVNGNDIISGGGQTNITMINDQFTVFAGDIQVNGDNIYASTGDVNITMQGNTLTSIRGDLRIEGNDIQAGTGATNITLLDGSQTIFNGDIRINGNSIRASNGLVNIELEDNTKTIFQGDIQVNGDDIRGADGTICITLEAPSGNVAIGTDLNANSVFFSGVDAVLNNENVKIKDNLIDIGLLEDPNNLGTLIGPNTTTNYDAGILLNYYSVGLDTSKKAAVFWDNSAERIAIASSVREVTSDVVTIDNYAALEANNLVINTVSGVRELFEDDGTYLQLKRVVIDAGTY